MQEITSLLSCTEQGIQPSRVIEVAKHLSLDSTPGSPGVYKPHQAPSELSPISLLTTVQNIISFFYKVRKPGGEVGINVLTTAIKDLEAANTQLASRLETAENSVTHNQSEIERVLKQVYHEGKLFSYATDVKENTLEELAKAFKDHREYVTEETRELAGKFYPVPDHEGRLARLERSDRDNFNHLLKCMKRLHSNIKWMPATTSQRRLPL